MARSISVSAFTSTSLVLLAVAQAGPRTPSLADARRDPAGYDWSVHGDLGAMPGPVTALAVVPQGVLAAHAPANRIDLVDAAGAVSTEARLQYGVTAITADGARASTGAPGVPGAADLHERASGGSWALALDGAQEVAVVGLAGGQVVAALGSPGQDGEVQVLGRGGGWQVAGALPGALPTAVAGGRRDAWVGAGPSSGVGPALLFSLGRRGPSAVALPAPSPALAAGERQQVEALLALDGAVIVALGVHDAGGAHVAGELLLVTGGRRAAARQVGQLAGEAPVSLAAADGSVYVGTSAGRLLHLEAGAWTDEPGLPANLGVTALAVDPAGQLLAGVHTAAGPRLLRRAPKLGAPPVAPANLAASATVLNRVDLSWTDASADETSFRIERAAAGTTAFAAVGSAPANATTYTDGSVAAATAYDYRVLAVNAAGASPPSNTATVMTLAAPAAPTYVADVKPILAGKNLLGISCAGCHAGGGRTYQLSPNLSDDAADYAATLLQVNTASPADSELLTRATQTRGHPVKLLNVGSPEYDAIVRWVQGGTKFN